MYKNDSKTDISILFSIFKPAHILHSLGIGDKYISASNSVTHLGVIFDRHIMMDKRRSTIAKSSYKVRCCLSKETSEMMVHAFITT